MQIRFIGIFCAVALSLTACTKAIIDPDAGGGGNQQPPELPEKAVYNDDVKNIMNNYCVTCHAGTAPSAGLSLTDYTSVRQATEQGQLQQRMNSATSPMPTSGLLPQSTRSIIDKWIQDGYPEN